MFFTSKCTKHSTFVMKSLEETFNEVADIEAVPLLPYVCYFNINTKYDWAG